MTAADLARIEAALGFELPASYRQFMLRYPRERLLAAQPEWLEPVTEWEFADNPDRVVAFNRFVRTQPDRVFMDDGPWPDHLLVIGNEADINYFAIDRTGADPTVLRWNHENGKLEPRADSLDDFVRYLLDWFRDIIEDDEEYRADERDLEDDE